MGKLEEFKNKYFKIRSQDTLRYVENKRRIDFSAGLIALMIGNIAAVCVFVSSSMDKFLFFSVASMFILFVDVLWTNHVKKVTVSHYLLAFIVTYIYGLTMYIYCESGIITFGLVYPVLSIFILKQTWGNALILSELITGGIVESIYNPEGLRSNSHLVYITVYLMFWAFSIIMENARIYMEKKIIQQKEQLEFYANYDGLTKLYNRRRFYDIIKEKYHEEDYNSNLSLIILDIDDFKKINDTYGHNSGDEILVELADRLKKGSREQDLICRWGGEEFLILAECRGIQKGREYAQKLCDNISHTPFRLSSGKELVVTASFGGIYIDDFKSSEIVELVHSADENLYFAKKNGKNRVCFSFYL